MSVPVRRLSALIGLWLLAPLAARADSSILMMTGLYASPVPWTTSGEARAEYYGGAIWATDTYPSFLAGFGPAAGVAVTTDGGLLGYGGVMADMRFGQERRWQVLSLFGAGGYRQGGARDLGGVFQFSMGTGVTYRLSGRSRFGVAYRHVSNAGIHRGNPGGNSALIVWTFSP